MIDISDNVSVREQCRLLSINRSRVYYKACQKNDEELRKEIEEIWSECPMYGCRKIKHELRNRGKKVNHKKVRRIMSENSMSSIIHKKIKRCKKQKVEKYPFLLKNELIYKPNQVWSTDITYIQMPIGFIYLMAILDVFSRKVLAWNISTTMEAYFCVDVLNEAISKYGRPDIINTDQGSQFTSGDWINAIKNLNCKISMDGIGRWVDNVYIERFWKTAKYEAIFEVINSMNIVQIREVKKCVHNFVIFYNSKRLHQNLGYKTPDQVYYGKHINDYFIYANFKNFNGSQLLLNLV
jgi:putative transposase